MAPSLIRAEPSEERHQSQSRAWCVLESWLSEAGVTLDGPNRWDIRVHDDRFAQRVLAKGSLGLGESYVDGWWDCDDLAELFRRILSTDLPARKKSLSAISGAVISALVDTSRRSRAYEIGRRHYDFGNDLFQAMLDEHMLYSCAYWKDATTLDQAQEAKLDLVCRKLGLAPGMRVLDVGCGWGGFARFAAERYGVSVVGVTVSEQQVELGRALTAAHPVELRLQDYRDLDEEFDAIVSIGMFEHVGRHNHRRFFDVMRRCLRGNGLLLLHTIGGRRSRFRNERWINKYIFPNSLIPSAKQITRAAEGRFVIEDWHVLGSDYHRTLHAWHANFERAWPELRRRYDDRFRRMWRYYLLSCAGSFRARYVDVWQIVFSRHGLPGGYAGIR